eukprot:499226-Pyramimonas_sp.AAC.1
MNTRGRDANAIVYALITADEIMANYDRYVLVDARSLDDPTHARHIGHRPIIERTSVENEHVIDNAEYLGEKLWRKTSFRCLCALLPSVVLVGVALLLPVLVLSSS